MAYETLARPYARAAFEFALAADDIAGWRDFLQFAVCLMREPKVYLWAFDPRVEAAQLLEVIADLGREWMNESRRNFLKVIIENKRLCELPAIFDLFKLDQAEHEKTLDVDVLTYSDFTPIQEKALVRSLEQRLQRHIRLHFKIDQTLLGGAVIRAGDLIIDGSVRTKLQRLQDSLSFD